MLPADILGWFAYMSQTDRHIDIATAILSSYSWEFFLDCQTLIQKYTATEISL